jgi:hypothetical protein
VKVGQLIISEIGVPIVIAFFTSLITLAFLKPKLRIEQKVGFEKIIGEQIANSLLNCKSVLSDISTIDKYDVENQEVLKAFDFGIYPSIMNNWETLIEFFDKINKVRENDESNLSIKAAAHTYILSNYIMEMMTYIKSIDMQNKLPEMGCIFIYDLQKWQHSFERVVIHDINKHSVKMSTHRGLVWELETKHLKKKLYDRSFLVLLQDDNLKNDKSIQTKQVLIDFIDNFKMSKNDE